MPLMNRIIGIGGTNAAKAIANKRIALFSMYKTNLGTNIKAVNVERT
tara:strand:+ start:648 stop:788 length:141 start_codon:yes stop_codon:yes gene_type:complete